MNALTVDMALGCSTNSMLHLPAIAHEAGFDFDIAYCKSKSVQRHLTFVILHRQVLHIWKSLNEAGGVYAVMKELSRDRTFKYRLYDSNRKDCRREH